MRGATAGERQSRIENAFLIVNPASRRGEQSMQTAIRELAALGVSCDAVITKHRGHAGELAAANARDYQAIFALGGDGTAVEILDALAPGGPPVGVLPGGTGNLLARALRIPLNIRRAVRAVVAGDEAQIDLGRLGDGTRFVIGAGVGIDSSMIAGTTQAWKRRAGVLAYIMSGAAHVLARRRFVARVTVDGVSHSRNAAVVLVANFGVLLNGLVTLGAGIQQDDGELDVCIFDPVNLSDTLRISRKLMFQDFTVDPAMTYLKGREILVETDPALPAQADGELIGTSPFTAVVEPLAARLLVPHCQINRQ